MTATVSSFRYNYGDVLEESLEASLLPLRESIEEASKWGPSVTLLMLGGLFGGLATGVANSAIGKLIAFVVPMLFFLLLNISSKETRVQGVRQQFELLLRKQFDEKRCHVHDLYIDHSGLVETCPCGTETRNWQAIKRWHETERVFVLEAFNKSFYAIPKRVIPHEELQSLRDLFLQHIH